MNHPQVPGMPGVGVMTDTLEFVKNLWGGLNVPGMGMPGMAVPTLSVTDLDKKISDLKAVEAWLNLNVSMLHGSIQALEVQRATIATLQSMGSAMASALKQPEGKDPASLFAAVPYASAFFAGSQAAQAAAHAAEQAAPAAAPAPAPAGAPAPAPGVAPAAMPSAADFAAQAGNPALWWNLLQEQFKQAINTAVKTEAPRPPETPRKPGPAAKTAAGVPAKPHAAAAPASPPAPAVKGAGKPRLDND